MERNEAQPDSLLTRPSLTSVPFLNSPSLVPSGIVSPLALATASTSFMTSKHRPLAPSLEANRFVVRIRLAAVMEFQLQFQMTLIHRSLWMSSTTSHVPPPARRIPTISSSADCSTVASRDGAWSIPIVSFSSLKWWTPAWPAGEMAALPPVQTTAEMMVLDGNEACRGASAPTPFWSRTTEVEGEMMGRRVSESEGLASSRALLAHRTEGVSWAFRERPSADRRVEC